MAASADPKRLLSPIFQRMDMTNKGINEMKRGINKASKYDPRLATQTKYSFSVWYCGWRLNLSPSQNVSGALPEIVAMTGKSKKSEIPARPQNAIRVRN